MKMSKMPPDVLHEIVCMVHKRMIPGIPVSDTDWDKAREIVYAIHQVETMDWVKANVCIEAHCAHIEWMTKRIIGG